MTGDTACIDTGRNDDGSPTVDIIIPTFRRSDLLDNEFISIFAQGRKIEKIFLVHRPDEDADAVAWLAANAGKWDNLIPVSVYVPGQVAAINAAFDRADSDIIIVLDDDIAMREGWIDKIVGHFSDPMVGAAGGSDFIHGPTGTATLKKHKRAGYRSIWGHIVGRYECVEGPPREVETIKGCNWAVRRTAMGTLRLDERLLGIGAQGGNDTWFCTNLRHAGWKIILDPTAVVDHYPAFKPDYAHGTWSQKKCFEWTANSTAYNLAFMPFYRKAIYALFAVVVGFRHCPGGYYFVHSLIKRPRTLKGQFLGGWAGFFKGLQMARDFGRSPPGFPGTPPLPGRR